MTIFDFSDYKKFLSFKIKDNVAWVGYKGKLAKAAGCQRAYLSQVLNSHVHLTPEHALGLTSFWSLKDRECDFFLELVNLARAGTVELKKHIQNKMALMIDSQKTVSGRISKPKIASFQLQAKYYSSWHYSAIHILLTISKFNTVSAIAERLSLSENIVANGLGTLSQMALATKENGIWKSIGFDLHLPQNSPFTTMNHQNWRLKALLNSQREIIDGIHFTSVYSLSETDFSTLKEILLQFIAESREKALNSKEEDVFSFSCDLFRV